MRSFTTHAVNADQTPSGAMHKFGTAISQTVPDPIEQVAWVRCGS